MKSKALLAAASHLQPRAPLSNLISMNGSKHKSSLTRIILVLFLSMFLQNAYAQEVQLEPKICPCGVIVLGIFTSCPCLFVFEDSDRDGFGNPDILISVSLEDAANPPIGLSRDNLDCDDTNPAINPTTLWVLDADNDGYQDPLYIPVASCTPPQDGRNYIYDSRGLDCDDSDATNFPKIWVPDADGDGYGASNFIPSPGGSCTPPQDGRNYISNSKGSDCNDNDPTDNPETVWIKDADGDGYYTGEPIIGCILIFEPGMVRKTTQLPGDCDDTNPDINPTTIWVPDADGDGYGSPIFIPSPGGSCTPPQDGRNYIFNSKGSDCNDNDPTDNPETVWIKDADGDGYYTGEPIIGCILIFEPGVVRKTDQQPGDCDDSNAAIYPGAIEVCDRLDNNCNEQIDEGAAILWYLDADGDGFAVNFESTCNSPGPGYTTNELPFGDCDDNNAAINPNTIWYEDRDDDGYTSGTNGQGCERRVFIHSGGATSLGKLATELNSLAIDCDDNNAAINPNIVWYKDADNDGYSDGTTITQCAQPTGYKMATSLTSTNSDCDDTNAAINPGATEACDGLDNNCSGQIDEGAAILWYLDADGDGFATALASSCINPGPGYTATVLPLSDCNDNDATINPNTVWYEDRDGDGYPSGRTSLGCERRVFIHSGGATSPGKLATELNSLAIDCNDNNAAINPGATEVCGNGNDDDCNTVTSDVCILPDADGDGVPDGEDCAPNDATKYRIENFFIDADNDGYDNGQAIICYGEEIPDGYKTTTLGSDCDDTNASVTVPQTWYQDADNDGFSNGNTLTQCDRPTGYKLSSELTTTTGDCNDNNSAINPGATEACDGIDNNCNGQTDEGFLDSNNNGVADCVDPDNDMVSFTLINAGTDLDILTLTDGLQISQNQVQGLSLNIRANTNPSVVGSVFITISGPVNRTITENVEPYALFGDRNGNYNGRNLPSGNYILTATPYSQSNRRGTVGSTTTLRFTIVPTPAPMIGSFTLINAGTDTDILTLTDGLQISQSQVQGLSLNIRANTNPSVVGSVYITLSGPVNRTITENVAPYALFGDRNGDYNGRNLPVGNYTLEATPYSQSNRRGTIGATVTIKFSITSEAFRTNGTQTESDESENPQENTDVMEKDPQARDIPRITRMYPNPVSDIINLELSGQVEEQVEVSIYDLKGVRLFNQEFESENGKLVLDITNLGLKPGMFILMVNTNGYPQTFKFLKK